MTDLHKAAEMAIEVLERTGTVGNYAKEQLVIQRLRQALAQPKQDPVAAVVSWEKSMITRLTEHLEPATFLYTAPLKREWVGLTDEEIKQIELSLRQYNSQDTYDLSLKDFAKAIETKLKEKNA